QFLDQSGQDLAQCCYRLFDSDLFQNNTLSITSTISDRAVQNQAEEDLWVTYHFLYYAGMVTPKAYNWMLTSEFFAKLKYQILRMGGMRLQPLAITLMYEICRVQSLKPQELAILDEDFLHYLLDLVERTRTDEDEGVNYSIIKLLLTCNEQFMLNQTACKAAYNYTPSNTLLVVLADRPGASCTFGENLIFMLNRADDPSLQMLILKLLYLLFTSPKIQLRHFFYTNDLHVLVDVIIRELWDLPEEQEPIRHAYLRVLGPLLKNSQLAQEQDTYKRPEILKLLAQLGGEEMDESLRQHLWEQEMRELEKLQAENENRKLTYRDRQSSNATIASTSTSSTTSTPLSSFSSRPQMRSSSISSCSCSSSSSSLCSSPIVDKKTAHAIQRPASSSSVSSAGSVILENVLPPTSGHSSCPVHMHMASPPSTPGAISGFIERRDSSLPPRSASPTTQRLVERVLREWLEHELKATAAAATAAAVSSTTTHC
ncbi:hypothetical protein BCR41DRAFT_346247, partial [Lobosporangium transversale]